MTYEDIWQKIKKMSLRNRKMLAYEMSLSLNSSPEGREAVGYIHPHYYIDAKSVHDILFYAPHSQLEIEDKEGKYYKALKELLEEDKEFHLRVKRHSWLPGLLNDKIEKHIIKDYISIRYKGEVRNVEYSISPSKDIAGERPHSLFITLKNGNEVVYKMTACNDKNGYEQMTFTKMG